MNEAIVIAIGKEVMMTTAYCAAPILLTALMVGLIVSIFQAVTQINEMTLTFIPKIAAAAAAMAIFYGFIMGHLLDFTNKMFTMFPHVIR